MEMMYDGELVMPSSFVNMEEEEMTYLEGGGLGKKWYNKRSFVGTVIDVGVAIFTGISGALSIARANKLLKKMLGKTMRKYMVNRIKKYIGSAVANLFSSVLSVISAISGWSIGGIVAYGMDRLDGKLDGYILA